MINNTNKLSLRISVILCMLSACKKGSLDVNPSYAIATITARQHLNAAIYASKWSSETLLEVKGTTFRFRNNFNGRLGDSVSVGYYQGGQLIRTKVYCDWDYINAEVRKKLTAAVFKILTDDADPRRWRTILKFDLELQVPRLRQTDTVVYFKYPFSAFY
ncbi:hypothetical protein [Chitinophaga barathri]|uniref:Uncharacterized protein n=1 Tax=Chitinophaga barathri TaxID=1647451 RepID=A0A3N4MI59_9BACT|nr:hypothetical protein [Chitinophaga barathri]RPD43125.1 hypothetical protein EG028_02185 [Chitinophaga barathri]